jgi:flagellar hook assembly protein FlgD
MVNITIYDMMGRRVKIVFDGDQNAGFRSHWWDATNNDGTSVSAGVYLYTIRAGELMQTRKMVLIK